VELSSGFGARAKLLQLQSVAVVRLAAVSVNFGASLSISFTACASQLGQCRCM